MRGILVENFYLNLRPEINVLRIHTCLNGWCLRSWARKLDFPIEIQKKARYLFITCFIITIGLSAVTIVHFVYGANLIMIVGDGVCYLSLILTLKCIKDQKIEAAANLLVGGLLCSLFLQKVIGDMLSPQLNSYLRLYETLSILILFLLFWGLFALRDRQLSIYTMLAVLILGLSFYRTGR